MEIIRKNNTISSHVFTQPIKFLAHWSPKMSTNYKRNATNSGLHKKSQRILIEN